MLTTSESTLPSGGEASAALAGPRAHNGARAVWRRFRSVMYGVRIVRDLVPAVTMTIAFFSLIAHFVATILGSSFDPAVLYPFQSSMLDKVIWHMTFTAAGRGALVHVYSSGWIAKEIEWKDSAPSDWWCILPIPFSLHYDAFFYRNEQDGKRVPRPLCKQGTETHGYFGNETSCKSCEPIARSFPDGDDAWRCVDQYSKDGNWPTTTSQGEPAPDYAFCVSVVGSKLHWPAWMPWSLWAAICSPILCDVALICFWLDLSHILDCFSGKASYSRKTAYFFIALFCLFWAVVFFFQPGVGLHYIAVLVFGLFFLTFLLLAISKAGSCLGNLALPAIQFLKCLYGVNDADDARAGHEIDTDAALAFFLVRGYGKRVNGIKRYFLFGIFSMLVAIMALYPDIPEVEFYPRQFMISQATTLGLVALSISKSLATSSFEVDYRVHRARTYEAYSKPLWTLAMQSNVLVEAESCRFLGLEHRFQVQDVVSF